MELNLSGKWEMALDPKNDGESLEWYLSGNFSKDTIPYYVPAFWFSQPFSNSAFAWVKREFDFKKADNEKRYYLVFFGCDKAKIWLNGKFVGQTDRTVNKVCFPVEEFIEGKNTLIIKFEDIQEESLGLWKYVYIIQDTAIPSIAKKFIRHTPKWVDNAVIYSVYTRNFSEEGTIKAVTKKLNYIRSLGVNTIWFLPIQPIGEIGRKGRLGSPYSIKDYYAIDPANGTAEDFKDLIKKAHSLNMKVILDLVINHTSNDSVMFQQDPKFFKPTDKQNSVEWGWTDVCELNYDYQPTRDYIKEMMAYWIKEFDLDGFRCDVAFLVPGDFWKDAITHVRSIKKDVLFLAEADNPELYECGFDLTYDWVFAGLARRISSGYFQLKDLSEYVISQFEYFPQNSKRLIFLENHDTSRAAKEISAELLPIMQLIKFFTPGIPLIYNGEEIGCKNTPDLFDNDPINWDNINPDIEELYKKISKFKKKYNPLNYHFPISLEVNYNPPYFVVTRMDLEDRVSLLINIETFEADILHKEVFTKILE